MCTSGDFSDPKRIGDGIRAIDLSSWRNCDVPSPVFSHARVSLLVGERADSLSEFTRVVGGDVLLDTKHRTARVQLFAGTTALRTQACAVLLDTGIPASFIQEKVWLRTLACGVASVDGLAIVGQKTWLRFSRDTVDNL